MKANYIHFQDHWHLVGTFRGRIIKPIISSEAEYIKGHYEDAIEFILRKTRTSIKHQGIRHTIFDNGDFLKWYGSEGLCLAEPDETDIFTDN